MRITTQLAFSAFISLVIFATPSLADIRVGITAEPYPPFTVKDASGKWVGWEIDLMNAVCAEMKEKCEFVETAWDGIIPALNAKKIDVIMASMAITDKRKEQIAFSDAYYHTTLELVGTKNGDKDVTPDHLAGKTIGVQVSTVNAAYAAKYFEGKSTIKTYQTQDEAQQDLAAGRIDYVLANAIVMEDFIASEQGGCCEAKAAVPFDVAILGEGQGAGIRKDGAELVAKFNAALKALAASGALEKITADNHLSGKIGIAGK